MLFNFPFWSRSLPYILDTMVVPIRSDEDNKVETGEKQKGISVVLLNYFYILCCCRGRFVSEVVMRWSHCLQWLPSKKKFISGNETLVPQVELEIA